MKLLALADIHSDFERFSVNDLPAADVMLFAGDLTDNGIRDPVALSLATTWLDAAAARYGLVIAIPGNHDVGLSGSCLPAVNGVRWVQGITTSFSDCSASQIYKLHGVNLSPSYAMPELEARWDFMTSDELTETVAYGFEPVDIVLSHAPPYGVLDGYSPEDGGEVLHIGSRALLSYIHRCAPALVICGHVHGAHGIAEASANTLVYNVAETPTLIEIPS
ncbi:metallophosphoesterase [Capsulimonas corticalis]|uniref:Metallophosphoesterase n=1 Tax=Capsulimonas corticalis TaxID=2219043 RepID=A0A402D643_9BACT|nr:metallophosphoesterase [Capsulimonas corticalis]BDI31498.1 metallophosphoesterase [Capsulimonas corticalis]